VVWYNAKRRQAVKRGAKWCLAMLSNANGAGAGRGGVVRDHLRWGLAGRSGAVRHSAFTFHVYNITVPRVYGMEAGL